MTENNKEEKKGIDVAEWLKLIGYVAAILVASTSLLSASGNVPSWWFDFSLIFLIMLILSVPCMIFAKPLSKRVKNFNLKNRRNTIAERYFLGFKNLVDDSKRFNSSIRSISDKLRTHYQNEINRGLSVHGLQTHTENEIQSSFYEIDRELNESNKTFRDLFLIMKHFELVLKMYKKNLKAIEEFAKVIQAVTQKPIVKGIETEFEDFREKYNYFVKDFKDYCQKVNQELGEREFPEWAIDHIQKW